MFRCLRTALVDIAWGVGAKGWRVGCILTSEAFVASQTSPYENIIMEQLRMDTSYVTMA